MQPDFLIIGAQKCATSWLHHHLRRHPGIFLPEDKDIEFFSYTVNLREEIFAGWQTRFDPAAQGQRVGDANAAYFWTETGSDWSAKGEHFNPDIPGAVHRYLGGSLQLIVNLRDPVERAVSAFLHHIHHGAITPGESLLDVAAPLGIVDMGFYAAHLRNWLEHYPPGQFLLIDGLPRDEITAGNILQATLGFLGLDEPGHMAPYHERIFPGITRVTDEEGVWAPANHPSLQNYLAGSTGMLRRESDGGDWLRLVSATELEELEGMFAQDQDALRTLLAAGRLHVVEVDAQ